VTASPAFGRLYIIPRLREFHLTWPDVTLDLQVSERQVNLVEDGIDVAIRIGHLSDSSLSGRRIGTMRAVTIATAGYLEQHGTPQTPAELGRHACIGYVFNGEPLAWGFRGPGRSHQRGTEGPVPK
jgi:LysR family transcriptional regulator for bpeEF and oprC